MSDDREAAFAALEEANRRALASISDALQAALAAEFSATETTPPQAPLVTMHTVMEAMRPRNVIACHPYQEAKVRRVEELLGDEYRVEVIVTEDVPDDGIYLFDRHKALGHPFVPVPTPPASLDEMMDAYREIRAEHAARVSGDQEGTSG